MSSNPRFTVLSRCHSLFFVVVNILPRYSYDDDNDVSICLWGHDSRKGCNNLIVDNSKENYASPSLWRSVYHHFRALLLLVAGIATGLFVSLISLVCCGNKLAWYNLRMIYCLLYDDITVITKQYLVNSFVLLFFSLESEHHCLSTIISFNMSSLSKALKTYTEFELNGSNTNSMKYIYFWAIITFKYGIFIKGIVHLNSEYQLNWYNKVHFATTKCLPIHYL